MAGTIDGQSLSAAQIQEHWQRTSASLAQLLSWMDSRESWVHEPDAESLKLLEDVIDAFNTSGFSSELEKGDGASKMAELLAMVSSSRFVRMLDMMDRRVPGIASRLTLALSRLGGRTEIYADLFYERLMVIHRAELLKTVLSESRCKSIVRCIARIQE